MTTQKIRSAVIPVAGLGTRFLPATKAVPKELLPIVDKPTLQYIVEEAVLSGIEQIVFVNGRNKGAIEDHFDYSYELEDTLRRRGKEEEANALKAIADNVQIVSVRQKFPGGLGHAVLAAKNVIGDAPFAVLLGDDLIRTDDDQRAGIGQLVDAFEATGLGQVALMTVPTEEIHKYGAAEGEVDKDDDTRFHISALVEKPPLGTEKTDQAVTGRYVLPASIWSLLEQTPKGRGGEIQLTDALHTLRNTEGLMGVRFKGLRVDAGDKLGYLTANLLEALSRRDLRQGTLDVMANLLKNA
ncbi:MAG: UTP--glucose-1-phosphate uridylyltransferase [Deltaproteobacteria bacterium]|nr:UTP--glucose-1-phosphate uridylyltransferase [Deltaproteobacteria bacterium]